jgi:hypothetical protein
LVKNTCKYCERSIFYTLPKYVKGLKLDSRILHRRKIGWLDNLKDKNGNPKTNRMYEIGDYTTVISHGYQFKKFNIKED